MLNKNWKNLEVVDDLLSRYDPDNERGGVVLEDGTVVELNNVAEDTSETFLASPSQILPFLDNMTATWHTHTKESANLSSEDFTTFVGLPDYEHIIVGVNNEIRFYKVKNNAVVNSDVPS